MRGIVCTLHGHTLLCVTYHVIVTSAQQWLLCSYDYAIDPQYNTAPAVKRQILQFAFALKSEKVCYLLYQHQNVAVDNLHHPASSRPGFAR